MCLRFLLPLTLITGLAHAQVNGWTAITPSPAPITGSTSQQFGDFQILSTGVVPDADAATPELVALAQALDLDPLRLYEWVRNNIEYVPYCGLKRGAHQTWLERAGNDFDQCALLMALLKTVPGVSASYRYGIMSLPDIHSSGLDVRSWLGADVYYGSTIPYVMKVENVTRYADNSRMQMSRVWIVATIGGQNYVLDPSYKAATFGTPLDIATVTNYSALSIFEISPGIDTGYSIRGLSPSTIRAKFDTYTTELAQHVQTQLHDKSGSDLVGGSTIKFERLQSLPTALAAGCFTVGVVETWTEIPIQHGVYFEVTAGSVSHSWSTAELRGRKIAVVFTANQRAQIWLDDTLVEEEATAPSTSTFDITYGFTYPGYASAFNSTGTHTNLPRGQKVVIAYGYDSTLGRLKESLKRQTRYVSQGLADDSRELSTENLQIAGLQWKTQLETLQAVIGGAGNNAFCVSHYAGLSRQGAAPVVDLPLNVLGTLPRSATAAPWYQTFAVQSFFMSALEHGVLEQLLGTGSKAFSTMKMMEYAMETGTETVFLADSSNYSTIKPQLVNYTNSWNVAQIESTINAGGRLLVHNNSRLNYNGTTAGGAFVYTFGSISALITGGYFGGSGTQPGIPDSSTLSFNSKVSPLSFNFSPTTHDSTLTWDPVDVATGAFVKSDVDLAAGPDAPHGLRYARHYNSAAVYQNPVGLGGGWTHSYDIRLQYRYPNDLDVRRASAVELAPLMVAARTILDLFEYNGTAKKWVICSIAANWAIDQLRLTRAVATLGDRSMEFVKLPNGTFAPPAGVSATLTKGGDGSHTLTFRHGNAIHFRASDGKFDSITDPYGNPMSATYTGTGQLYQVTDAYNRTLTFSYDGNGRLFQVADSTGRQVGYARDGVNTFSVTDAEGKVTKYGTDGDNRITWIEDARNRQVVANSYDQWGRVYEQNALNDSNRLWKVGIAPGVGSEEDPEGGRHWYYFDARGRRIAYVNHVGGVTRWEYDGVDRLIKTTSPRGATVSRSYNSNHEIASETNADGNTRTIIFDTQGRPKDVPNFEGKVTTLTYNDFTGTNGTVYTRDVATITAPGGIVTSSTYDSKGRLWTHHPAAFAAGQVMTYAYDPNGHIDTITFPGTASNVDNYLFNVRGDLTELIDRRGAKTTYGYNKRRQQTSVTQWKGTSQLTSQTVYDDAGNVDYTLDASGRKTDFDYNALGHLASTAQGAIGSQVTTLLNTYEKRNLLESSTDALSHTTILGYDSAHRLKTTEDPLGRLAEQGYDGDGNPTTVISPLKFETTTAYKLNGLRDGIFDAESQAIDYEYDKDGRLKTLANRRNQSFTWTYDDDNRKVTTKTPLLKTTIEVRNTRGLLEAVKEPSSPTAPTITFDEYDSEGRLKKKMDGVAETTYTYWPNGLLKEITESGRTTYREYDEVNRLKEYRDGEGNTITYQYYAAGELWKITYPGDKTVTYDYDDFGRLWHVTDWSDRVTTYTYDDASRLTRIDRPNLTYRVQEYDEANQLRFIKEYKSNGTLIFLNELRYDWDGRITSSFLHPSPAPFTLPQDTFGEFDSDNRITTWNGQTVTFDENGNMTHGPLPSGTFGTYGYDARNRLNSAGGSGYRYNPDGLRVEITGTGAASFVVDPNAALSRVLRRTKGGATTYYVYGLGLLYEETNSSTKTYHANQVGSTLAITDDSEAVTDRVGYSPFGVITERTGTTDTPFLFHGELGVMTEQNGLNYMRARFFHPRLARFLNSDPIGLSGGMNLFLAFDNDPIRKVDAMGLWSTKGPTDGAFYRKAGFEPVHQIAVERALSFLPTNQIQALQARQLIMDEEQSPALQFMHSMADGTVRPHQTVSSARAAANDYLKAEFILARASASFGNTAEAMVHLGNAIHTLQDSTSPVHFGFQLWFGNTSPTSASHPFAEKSYPGDGSNLFRITQQAWMYFTGHLSLPDNFFGRRPMGFSDMGYDPQVGDSTGPKWR